MFYTSALQHVFTLLWLIMGIMTPILYLEGSVLYVFSRVWHVSTVQLAVRATSHGLLHAEHHVARVPHEGHHQLFDPSLGHLRESSHGPPGAEILLGLVQRLVLTCVHPFSSSKSEARSRGSQADPRSACPHRRATARARRWAPSRPSPRAPHGHRPQAA